MWRVEGAYERRSPWLLIISLVLAGLLLVLTLRGIHWHETFITIRHGRSDLLILAATTLSLSYFARGLRWQRLIGAATPISSAMAFWTTMTSYLANNILPARPGDVIRPILTSRLVKTSVSFALAAVFLERIADILTLVLMSIITSFSLGAIPTWLHNTTRVFAIAGLAGAICLVLVVRMERMLGSMVARLPVPQAIRARMAGMLQQFSLGLRALDRPWSTARFGLLTALIWLLDVVTGMAIAWALHISVSWSEMMVLLVALSLASALPSTPGNIGVFPFVAISVLVPFGLTRSVAFAYILVFQAITYLVETVWGGIGLWRITVAYAPAPPVFVTAIGCGKEMADERDDYRIASDPLRTADRDA